VKVVELRDESGATVCARCAIADNPWTRFRGLLGRSGLDPDEGLLIRPAGSIHMFFMRFAIDAVFLDRELVVLRVVPDLQPGKTAACRGAKAVLELPAGAAARAGIREGARLSAGS
jgi:uncharacterized membrane protein (UPF0127 family)